VTNASPDWASIIADRTDESLDAARVVVLSEDLTVEWASPALLAEGGWDLDAWVGLSAAELVHPGDLDRAMEVFGEVVDMPGVRPPGVYRVAHANGRFRAYDVSAETLSDPRVVVLRLCALSERRSAEMLAIEQIEILEMMGDGDALDPCLRAVANMCERHLDGSMVLVHIVADVEGRTELRTLSTGEAPVELIERSRGHDLAELPEGDFSEAARRRVSFVALGLADHPAWASVRATVASMELASMVITPIAVPSGELVGFIEEVSRRTGPPTNSDYSVHMLAARMAGLVFDRTRDRSRIVRSANQDALTGLGNRRRLNRCFDDLRGGHGRYAVASIDLDQFAWVNNRFGHAAGDALLVEVGNRLAAALPADVELTRPGGDEFVAVVPSVDYHEQLLGIGETIRSALADPVVIEGHERRVRASVGFAVGARTVEDPSKVLARADAAMYVVKRRGGAGVRVFDAAARRSVLRPMQIADELTRALEHAQFQLAYQPVLDLGTNTVTGVEALVRWRHPQFGVLSPDEFIPVAEDRGSIVDIDRWVMGEAVAQAHRWGRRDGVTPPTVWVNVSAETIDRAEFPDWLDEVTAGTLGVPLGIEVTERTDFEDEDRARANIRAVREREIPVVIDDFGPGTGSLQRMASFDVSGLKIDRSFIQRMHASRRHFSVVESVLGLARRLSLSITAEGVENHRQLAMLRSLDCPVGQGFLFGRPSLPEVISARFWPGLQIPWGPLDVGVSDSASPALDRPMSAGDGNGLVERFDDRAGPVAERVGGGVA